MMFGRTCRLPISALALSAAVATHAQAAPELPIADMVKAAKLSIGKIVVKIPYKRKDGNLGTHVGTGTGFVVDGNGDLVTNCHVVSSDDDKPVGKIEVAVQFPDDPALRLNATVVGCDAPGDIAVIHVDGLGAECKPLRFADARTIEVGQEAIAIGFADAIDGEATVSRGIVSALHRSYLDGTVSDLVQTDAAVNHGDSGGPLLNRLGEVVGVNSYISVASVKVGDIVSATAKKANVDDDIPVHASRTGISYARSAETAARYARAILANGAVSRPDLGVVVKSPDFSSLTLPRSALFVKSVDANGAAASIGLHAGDFVYSVAWSNGFVYPVWDQGSLSDALARIEPGDKVKIHFYRMTEAGIDAAADMATVPDAEVQWFYVDWSPLVTRPKRDEAPARQKSTNERIAELLKAWQR
ncbi:S1C family serine protease [Lichenifustis flavocetrariae]|uniref:S1C family serine protease n=1 Tax=Lichenifustis flavocetrariae TaxID=2949735 RepID=A0AA42CJA1_9HYPH|nr:S1C family serine protease [Lichenifustis flavocetrariae]